MLYIWDWYLHFQEEDIEIEEEINVNDPVAPSPGELYGVDFLEQNYIVETETGKKTCFESFNKPLVNSVPNWIWNVVDFGDLIFLSFGNRTERGWPHNQDQGGLCGARQLQQQLKQCQLNQEGQLQEHEALRLRRPRRKTHSAQTDPPDTVRDRNQRHGGWEGQQRQRQWR